MKEKSSFLHMRLCPKKKAKFIVLAKQQGLTISKFVDDCIDKFIAKNSKK